MAEEPWIQRRRATAWGGAAAIAAVVATAGAVHEAMVVLGAIGAFVYVHYGLLDAPEDGGPADKAPAARAPDLERAALASSSSAAAPAPDAAPAPVPAASAPAPAADAAVAQAPAEVAAIRPDLPAGPPATPADDLKRIKGIGPKLETLLNTMGVHHFAQIAGWTPAEVAWVDAHLEGFKGRVTRDDWVAQARVLAAGAATDVSARAAAATPSSRG